MTEYNVKSIYLQILFSLVTAIMFITIALSLIEKNILENWPKINIYAQRYFSDIICISIFVLFLWTFIYLILKIVGFKIVITKMNYININMINNNGKVEIAAELEAAWYMKSISYITGAAESISIGKKYLIGNKISNLYREKSILSKEYINIIKNNVDNNLILISFGLWALPITGFIGTVWGVSKAIQGLKNLLESSKVDQSIVESLPIAMSNVMDGLSTAFDTTLLGLVGSLIIMFPFMIFKLKINEHFDYSNAQLLNNLTQIGN